MLTKLQRMLKNHIKHNFAYYIFILCGFVCGGIIAAVCVFGLSELDYRELTVYFADFFSGINKTGTDSFEIFRLSVMSNLKLYMFAVLLAMMIIGTPLIPAISGMLGYSVFFTLFFLFKAYTLKGVLFYIAGMLPHQLISFFCHAGALMTSMQFSVSLLKERGDIKKRLISYLMKMSAMFLITVFASLLQGYIEPIFIRLIAPLFIS